MNVANASREKLAQTLNRRKSLQMQHQTQSNAPFASSLVRHIAALPTCYAPPRRPQFDDGQACWRIALPTRTGPHHASSLANAVVVVVVAVFVAVAAIAVASMSMPSFLASILAKTIYLLANFSTIFVRYFRYAK